MPPRRYTGTIEELQIAHRYLDQHYKLSYALKRMNSNKYRSRINSWIMLSFDETQTDNAWMPVSNKLTETILIEYIHKLEEQLAELRMKPLSIPEVFE